MVLGVEGLRQLDTGFVAFLGFGRWAKLNDELSVVMRRGEVLHGFSEGPLAFPPSFR